jgi:hypothetical protein
MPAEYDPAPKSKMQSQDKHIKNHHRPAYCPLRSCRRANRCMGNNDNPCLAGMANLRGSGSEQECASRKSAFMQRLKQIDDKTRLMLDLCKLYKPMSKTAPWKLDR